MNSSKIELDSSQPLVGGKMRRTKSVPDLKQKENKESFTLPAAQFGDGYISTGDQLGGRETNWLENVPDDLPEKAKKFVKTEKITAGITTPSFLLGVGGIAATLATFFIIGFPPLGLGLALAGGALLIGTGIVAFKKGLDKERAIAGNAQNKNIIKYPTEEYKRHLRLINKKAEANAKLREAAEAINKNHQLLEEMRQGLKDREKNLAELNSLKQKFEEEKTKRKETLSDAESDLSDKEKVLETATVKFNYLEVLSEKYTQEKDSLENTKQLKDALQKAFDEQKKAFQETQVTFKKAKKSLDKVLRQISEEEADQNQASNANSNEDNNNNDDNDSNANLDLSGNEGLNASVQAMLEQAKTTLDEIKAKHYMACILCANLQQTDRMRFEGSEKPTFNKPSDKELKNFPNLGKAYEAAKTLETTRQEVENVIDFLNKASENLAIIDKDEQNAKTAINTIQGIFEDIDDKVETAIGTEAKSKNDLEALVDKKISDAKPPSSPEEPEDISERINQAKTEAQQAQKEAQEARDKAKQVRNSAQANLNNISDYLEYIDWAIEATDKKAKRLSRELQKVDGKPKKKSSTSEEASEIIASDDDEFHEDEEVAPYLAQQKQNADNNDNNFVPRHDNLFSGNESLDDLNKKDDK